MKAITGGFQNPNGTPVANGKVYFTLSQDATAVGGPKITGNTPVSFVLDANGHLPVNASIWYQDELTPSTTAYSVAVVAAGGGLVYGPEYFIFIGASPTNINGLFPSIYGGSPVPVFSAALLQNPISPQTITGQSLTLTPTAPLILQGTLTGTTGSFSGAVSFQSITGPGFQKQIFVGNGTFTIPAGITQVKVTVVGGGSAGGGTAGTNAGTGGGAGGVALKWLTGLTPGNTLAVVVGAGGTGVSNGNGNNGNNSTVSSGTQTISTVTGNGATGASANGSGGGQGGGASGGDLNFIGGSGFPPSAANGGVGANSIFGGGAAFTVGTPGNTGGAPGAGGSGCGSGGGAQAGGSGGNGIVIFEWVS